MAVGKRDWKYGPHIYAPVWKWEEAEGAIHQVFDGASLKLNALFQHIYFKEHRMNSSGEFPVDVYIDVGTSAVNIEADFLQLFDERYVAFPYYPCSAEGNAVSIEKMKGALAVVLDKYEWKYRKLVESLGFIYNPIENYNMKETGSDTNTPTGTTTKTHNVDSEKVGMIKLSGVVDTATITEDEDGKYVISNLSLDADGQKLTKADGVSDIQAGKYADRTQGGDLQLLNGTTPQTKNYTTTMDSAALGRLHNYSETFGSTGQTSFNNLKEQIPIMGEVQSGNPHFASYTDTETYTSRVDTLDHSLTRSGNIGVTTSQQMIEQERNVVRYSILNEFFNDLNRELLLAVWD